MDNFKQKEKLRGRVRMHITVMIVAVCFSFLGCGTKGGDSDGSNSYPDYKTSLAAGTLNGKAVTYSSGYVVSGKASVNGQQYSSGSIYFFSDASIPICPTARVPVPTPRVQFFLPLVTGEHSYDADPQTYKTMPGYWDSDVSPNTDKTAKSTSARIQINTWTQSQLNGQVYAKGDKLEINGTFDLKNCDGVLPQ